MKRLLLVYKKNGSVLVVFVQLYRKSSLVQFFSVLSEGKKTIQSKKVDFKGFFHLAFFRSRLVAIEK